MQEGGGKRMGANWFENLITSAIEIMRASRNRTMWRKRRRKNSNPYQLSREWLTRVSLFKWFRNKIQISISEIESNLREWFNQNTGKRIGTTYTFSGTKKGNLMSNLDCVSRSSLETMELVCCCLVKHYRFTIIV